MTKEQVLDAVRQCLYGDCKHCPLVHSIRLSGSRDTCRMGLLCKVEEVLTEDKEWLPEPYHEEQVM